MTFITSDQIRDISVKAVEMFLNEKVPLSMGLAKQASAMELNSDQIQRAVEATNSIAYLKILSLSEDRTMEFPLCKYAEVMHEVTIPEEITLQKTASVDKSSPNIVFMVPPSPGKSVSVIELHSQLIKSAALNKAELNQLRDRAITIVPEITKVASEVKSDNRGLEKIATVAKNVDYKGLSQVVYGEVKPYEDTGIFKEAELKTVNKLASLIKEAQELGKEIKRKEELDARSELVKEAFLGAIGAGIGRVIGSTVAAPFKVLGGAIGRTAYNVGHTLENTGRKVVGKAPVEFTKKRLGIGSVALTGASVGADAVSYSPGVDKITGQNKDVWGALQRNNY